MIIAVYPEFAGVDNPVKNNGKGVYIGEGVVANRNIMIYCAEHILIGSNCLLGSNILIANNNHEEMVNRKLPYSLQPLTTKETIIEEGCWIEQNVCVLAGSYIGKNSIIGANSVVCGTIPEYSIAVGNSARVIKKWDFIAEQWVSVYDVKS